MRRHLRPPVVIGAAGVLLVLAIGLAVVLAGGDEPQPVAAASPASSPSPSIRATPLPTASPSPSARPTPSPAPPETVACPLNGLATTPEALARTALVVQIENHPAARPAANLSRADLVVEAPVEGDTTRFSAIFLCQDTAGLTGPVRSARYYNVDLWQALRLLTVGYGASNGALDRFSAAGMPYVNGIGGQWSYFERISSRVAPHNLYANIEALRRDLDSGHGPITLAERAGELRPPFSFASDPLLPEGRSVDTVTIRTNSYWNFGWHWSSATTRWERRDAGVAIIDAEHDEPVAARSVIVQLVTQETVYGDPDPAGNPRRLQHLVGSGQGTAYVDGRAFAVSWSRPDAKAETIWRLTDTGEPLVLPPGTVWWEIIPTTATISEG
jgi:hypothetical protein